MEKDAMDVDSHSSTDSVNSSEDSSPNGKARHWKKVARKISMREQTIKREFKEYQENSTAYESEMETMFRQSEQINQKLRRVNDILEMDNKILKDKTNRQTAIIDALQGEIRELKMRNDELTKYNRRLEQENDDLERYNRETKMTEEETECQLNETLEKLALLETDMDDREELLGTIQRLKDENRDLIQQIKVEQTRQKKISRDSFSSTDERSRNGSFMRKKSIRECVSETGYKIENWDRSDRSVKTDDEENDAKLQSILGKRRSPDPEISVKQNFKAVIEEFKENKDELPKKRQCWLFSMKKSSSGSSNNNNDYGKEVDEQGGTGAPAQAQRIFGSAALREAWLVAKEKTRFVNVDFCRALVTQTLRLLLRLPYAKDIHSGILSICDIKSSINSLVPNDIWSYVRKV